MTDTPLNRRQALTLGGAALGAAALAACGSGDSGGSGTGPAIGTQPGTAEGTCVLTSEATQGPYWLDDSLVRRDITEGKPGVKLTLRLIVVDHPKSCAPLPNAAVEIWHGDALGYYSGYTTTSPGGNAAPVDGAGNPRTFLRGIQLTDANGVAEFTTIFPGWYTPRAVHIHCRVYTGGAIDQAKNTYEGGTARHTGQFFFADQMVTEVESIPPYSHHTGDITKLADDPVYTGKGAQDGLLSVAGNRSTGYTASLTIGVDPNTTSTGEGGPAPAR